MPSEPRSARRLVASLLLAALLVTGCAVDRADPDDLAAVLPPSTTAATVTDDDRGATGSEASSAGDERAFDEPAERETPVSPGCDATRAAVDGELVAIWEVLPDGRMGRPRLGTETPEANTLRRVFEDVVPPEQRGRICLFVVFDGQPPDDTAGYASMVDPRSGRFEFAVEVDEVGTELIFTVAHEFAHVLTLGRGDVDDAAFERSDCEGVGARELAGTCVLDGSELDLWVERFWSDDLLAEHRDRVIRRGDAVGFFDDHQSEFFNDYSVTDPSEDLAEMFGVYVLDLTVDSPTLQAKKAFFDEFPELRSVREHFAG